MLFQFFLKSIAIMTGMPRRAATVFIGMTEPVPGSSATISAKTVSTAPIRAEAGIRTLWSAFLKTNLAI